MKKIVVVLIAFLYVFNSVGQASAQSVENWCGTAHRMNELMQDPAYLNVYQQDEQIRVNEAAQPSSNQKLTLYKIPIVFHIVHNNGPENVSEEQIFNALEVLNRDFRKENADTVSIVPEFKSLARDAEIEFVLATKAPNGACFRGYTRTQSATTFSGGGNDGDAQVNAVRNGNDVFQGNWPSNKYLNIYVIADAGGAGGYTQYPSNFNFGDMENGIWILHTQFSEIGTSNTSTGRSLTHECGHWFRLAHTWGSSNTPGPGNNNCSTDDSVSDTPFCEGASGGCPTSQVTCGSLDNVQNYMDYALSCQSMFTSGQVDRMRDAVTSSVGGRNNLWTVGNLNDTGADGVLALCQAEFSANKTSVCIGTQIQFTDESYNDATDWEWSFPGGVPPTSTDQNPIVTYSTPGYHSVTLEATDGVSSDTEIKNALVHVVPLAENLPLVEGFESYTTLNNIEEWSTINGSGNGFEITSSAGLNSTKSARLRNYGQTAGDIDELIASPVDLSGVSQVTLSFRYAHKRRNTSDDDQLKLHITKDCGDNWAVRRTILFSISSPVQSSSFTPSSESDWTTVHVTNITSSYLVDNFRYKFSFEGGGGNNFYLDNINIYEGAPSDDIVDGTAGIVENSGVNGLSIYPNPVDKELSIDFAVANAQKVVLTVQDVSGKITQRHLVNANAGSNVVLMDTQNLSSGVYFIEVATGGERQVKQFMVK